MPTVPMDDYVLRHAPGPTVEAHPIVGGLRTAIRGAEQVLATVPDAALESAWPWNGGEADVRYGFYRLFETLEGVTAEVRTALADAVPSPAAGAMQAATRTRWAMHGVLAGVSDADLDADPGGGEWTLRQTLAHIVSSQRGYAWGSAWWLSRRDAAADDFPTRIAEEEFAELPAEETEALGTLDDIRARFDGLLDWGIARYAALTPPELATRARWSGTQVTIGFRSWRWSSHTREHCIQLEKTLAMLDRRPTEVQRLIGLLLEAYGELEATVSGIPAAELERAAVGGGSAAALLASLPEDITRRANEVSGAAASAPSPA